MADFKAIETQEELDIIIKDRLKREREASEKKLAEYEELQKKVKEYETQISDYVKKGEQTKADMTEKEKKITELESQIKGYETVSAKTRIAHEVGLPYELAARLSGDDEESIRKDAEGLKELIGARRTAPPPLAGTESSKGSGDKNSAYAEMLKDLEKGE